MRWRALEAQTLINQEILLSQSQLSELDMCFFDKEDNLTKKQSKFERDYPLIMERLEIEKEDIKDGLAEEFYRRNFFEIILGKKPKIEIKKHYKNGKLHGSWEMFYSNGQVYWRMNYKNGKDDGPFEKFHPNGQLLYRENYKDGKLVGPYEMFYKNGQLSERVNYKDGIEHGSWEMFYQNGQLKGRGNYKNGEFDGLLEYFDENGNLDRTEEWKDGERIN